MASAVILVTGGFDPIHDGHIAYLSAAKNIDLTCPLWVGLNNDQWLIDKKGYVFQTIQIRKTIMQAIKYVDQVFEFDGYPEHSIGYVLGTFDQVYVANGGDRNISNIPEYQRYNNDSRVIFYDGIGGPKINSSSNFQVRETPSNGTSLFL